MTAIEEWVILELSPKADGEDPDLVRMFIAHTVRGAEVFIPAAVTQVGDDRVIHYLMEGYAFIRHNHPQSSYARLENSKYVQNVLTKSVHVNGARPVRQLATIPTLEIERMRKQIRVETEQGIEVDDIVMITSGPYRHISAKVMCEIPEKDSVQVFVALRSKETIVTLPRSFLRLVEKAPKSKYHTQIVSLRDWFRLRDSLYDWTDTRLIGMATAYGRYSQLNGWLVGLRIAEQPFEAPHVDLSNVADKATQYTRLHSWSSDFNRSADFVRSFYQRIEIEPIRRTHSTLERLSTWSNKWDQLTPFVRAFYTPIDVETLALKAARVAQLQQMTRRFDEIRRSIAKIEAELVLEDRGMFDNLIIDGLNLAFRCLYAPGMLELRDTHGRQSGMIYGFLRVLVSMRKRFPDAAIHVAWDGSSKYRKAKYAGYKANRTSHALGPNDFDQVGWLRETLTFFGVQQYINPDEEADDVIAALVRGPLKGKRNVMLSSDRDLLQLVTPTDVLLVPAQGKLKETFFDVDAVVGKYGVQPLNMVNLRALQGDTSDNLPGVPTVPDKVLVNLLELYGSVDGIYKSSLAGLTKLRYDRLRSAESQVRLNFELMTLRDVPFTEIPTSTNQTAAEARLLDVDVQVEPILAAFFAESATGFVKST